MGRCDLLSGEVKGLEEVHHLTESMTVINGGVKGIKNECQLIERCDGHGGGIRGWRGVMVIREVFGGMGR